MLIKKEEKDYFVRISRCTKNSGCDNEQFTAPSFACDKARTEIEKTICRRTDLSSLDIQLDLAYKAALGAAPSLRHTIVATQEEWARNRSLHCILAKLQSGKSQSQFAHDPEAACLAEQYYSRIGALEKFISESKK